MSGNNLRFQIGEAVWRASFESVETSVECPDCGGTGRLHVTFHDGQTVAIECANCSKGFEGPIGRVKVYDRTPMATPALITGVRIDGDEIEWQTADAYADAYIVPDSDVFVDRDQCLAAAQEKAAEYDRAERERVLKKEKDTRSWAWNASYHRKEIKEAKRRIEYHEAKLAVASLKAKEEKHSAGKTRV